MKVKELIALLQSQNQELRVVLPDYSDDSEHGIPEPEGVEEINAQKIVSEQYEQVVAIYHGSITHPTER